MSGKQRLRDARRRLLRGLAAVPVALYLPRVLAEDTGGELPATPACGEDEPPTPHQTAGPFYTPDSPAKPDFRADDPDAEPLILGGFLLDTRCRPLSGAVVDLWYANRRGRYDNDGYRLRGHQRTDARGAFHFIATLPGSYPFRTRHYHVRIFAPGGGRLLTTQLYFPGESSNSRDFLFRPELVMDLRSGPDGRRGRFDFVVAAEGA